MGKTKSRSRTKSSSARSYSSSSSKTKKFKKPNYGKLWVQISYQFLNLEKESILIKTAKKYSGVLAESRYDASDHIRFLIFNKFKNEKSAEEFVSLAIDILTQWQKEVKNNYKFMIKAVKESISKKKKAMKTKGITYYAKVASQSVPWKPFITIRKKK